MFSAVGGSFIITIGGSIAVVVCILTATDHRFTFAGCIFTAIGPGFTVAVCDFASTRYSFTATVFDFTVIIYDIITLSLFSSTVGGLLQKRFSALELRDVVAQQPIVLVIKRGDVEGMNRHRCFLIEIAFTVDRDLIAVCGLLQRQSGHTEIDQLTFRKLVFT